MVSRKERKARQSYLRNALKRYERDRVRNRLATPGPFDFVLVLDHLKASFNIPKIFRSAEAFGAHAIHLIGSEPFDPAPAKGAFRKVPARFHDRFADSHAELRAAGYTLFRLEADCGNSLYDTPLPRRAAFILGNEGVGITFDPANYPDVQCLAIPLVGQTESLNVSIAASIVMYEYVRQWLDRKDD